MPAVNPDLYSFHEQMSEEVHMLCPALVVGTRKREVSNMDTIFTFLKFIFS